MVRENTRLIINDAIFTMIDSNGHRQSYLSPISGRVIKLFIRPSDILSCGSIILEYEECRHTLVYKNLCSNCGMNLIPTEDVTLPLNPIITGIKMEPSFPDLVIHRQEGIIYDSKEQNDLLRRRKLHLLVDLDQTLVHTTDSKMDIPVISDIISYQLTPVSATFHTKIRPGVKKFLTNLYPFYQFYLVTFGDRLYAETIAKIIDPNKTFFSHRILSRNECLSLTDKSVNLSSLFPSGDSLVCIIDDREDVWNSAPNLVQVKPYTWFKDIGDINDPLLPSRDENYRVITNDHPVDTDQYLVQLESILKKIHTEFYTAYDQWSIDRDQSMPDLKWIIPNLRQQILRSVSLSFSHLMPQDQPLEKHRATIIAKALGAHVTRDLEIDDEGKIQTTHVIAGKRTYKVFQAQQENIHVVTPEWLLDCYEYWERKPEEHYQFTKSYQVRKSRLFTDKNPRITIKRRYQHVEQEKQSISKLNEKVNDLSIEDSDQESEDIGQRPKKQQRTTISIETMPTTNVLYEQDQSDLDSSDECRLKNLNLNDEEEERDSDEQGLSDDDAPRGWKNPSKRN